MFSLARNTSTRACAPFTRSFAQAVPQTTTPQPPALSWKSGKVPVKEDHGLYGFFKRKPDAGLTGEQAYDTLESPRTAKSGRAWRASELRLKSFQDLHTLWYVSLRERNRIASQEEEARRMGVQINLMAQTAMAGACRKTMARIKAVMNERRLAYEGALALVEEQKEQVEDKKLIQMQRDALKQAKQKLVEFQTRGKLLRREKLRMAAKAKQALKREGVAVDGLAEPAAADSTPEAAQVDAQAQAPPAAEFAAEPTPEAPSRPQTAAETAAAGLFGAAPNRK